MQALGFVSPWLNEIFVRGVITLALQVVIIGLMWRKKLAGRFPFFFSYVLYQIGEGIFRWIVEQSKGTGSWAYYYTYWSTEAVDIVLLSCALWESSWHVFRCFRKLQWFRRFLITCIGGILAYSVISALVDRPLGVGPGLSIITRLDLIATFVPTGLAILFFGFVLRYEAWRWFTRETSIIMGLGITSAVGILTMAARSYFGKKVFAMTVSIGPWAYVAAELVWIREFLQPEPPPVMTQEEYKLVRPLMEEISKALDRYSEALKKVR